MELIYLKYLQKKLDDLHRNAHVYILKTDDSKFIVSIPQIHWSTELNVLDEFEQKVKHLIDSLNFHMYDGDSKSLAQTIGEMTITKDN
ncbi:YueH family protein [Niallia taxi]|uniref:YueH family protein n=1 Tax=Niallia taxi TaxID=2499688 RepID=UPI0039822286